MYGSISLDKIELTGLDGLDDSGTDNKKLLQVLVPKLVSTCLSLARGTYKQLPYERGQQSLMRKRIRTWLLKKNRNV